MSFLLPLGFFFAASLPALLVFYLLKVKRKPRRVSSTQLWRATVEDARASVPFQKLRRNLLMFLQLSALALLTFAIARPVVNLVARESTSAIILIDQSASMAMRETPGGPTRLDEAKDAAGKFIAGLPRGSQVLILPYAERAAVEIPFTTDRPLAQRGLAALEPKAAEDRLEEAIALAASLTSSAPNPRIVIFSDSAELTPKLIADLGGTPAAVQSCGRPSPNAGWTALDLRRRSAADDVYDLFGKISVSGGEARQIVVEVRAEGKLLDARRIDAAPGAEAGIVVEGLELTGEPVIEAAYLPQAGEADALALDNRVWTQLRPGKKLRLLLYGPGNYFLSRVLAAAGDIEVVQAGSGQKPPPGDYDLAIYDRAAPEDRPAVPALFIGVSPWAEGALAADPAQETAPGAIVNWDGGHPVTAAVQWSTVTVFGTQPAQPPPGSRALIEAEAGPLLTLGRADSQVALHLAFDLFRSNLPLRAAFPIFLMNALDFLSEGRASRETESMRGGETLRLAPPAAVKRVTITSPSGKGWELRPGPDGSANFSQLYEPGLWEVQFDGKAERKIGVNLLNARESEPAVAEASTLDAAGLVTAGGIENELRTNQEIWRWFALAALGLLLAEWYFYQRSLGI